MAKYRFTGFEIHKFSFLVEADSAEEAETKVYQDADGIEPEGGLEFVADLPGNVITRVD